MCSTDKDWKQQRINNSITPIWPNPKNDSQWIIQINSLCAIDKRNIYKMKRNLIKWPFFLLHHSTPHTCVWVSECEQKSGVPTLSTIITAIIRHWWRIINKCICISSPQSRYFASIVNATTVASHCHYRDADTRVFNLFRFRLCISLFLFLDVYIHIGCTQTDHFYHKKKFSSN